MKKKNTKKEITMNDLALMVGKGFNEMGERFDRVENRLNALEKGQENLEKDVADLKIGQANLEKGQAEIKFELTSRVHIFDYKELEFRVERLEEKTGLSRRKQKMA
ncbi:MAG: hypothetical protein PHF35_03095 [Candidatus Moranbacteria bacterium]|nr:hypothetical protein [Candidatus Moranbacteria bacterium]